MANPNDFWKNLSPARKQRFLLVSILLLIIGAATAAYTFKDKVSPIVDPRSRQKEIRLDPGVLEKTMVSEAQQTAREQNKKIEKLKKEIEAIRGVTIDLEPDKKGKSIPIPPDNALTLPPPPLPILTKTPKPISIIHTEEIIGAITVATNPFLDELLASPANKKKNQTASTFLLFLWKRPS